MKLFPFQEHGVSLMLQKQSLLLADEMGLGKTIQTTSTVNTLLKQGDVQSCLIVCPDSIKRQWAGEILLWTGAEVNVFNGGREQRAAIWKKFKDGGWFIIGYESLLRDGLQFDYCTKTAIVYDEASRLKNWKTKTYKLAKKLRGMTGYFYCLTGTPVENNLMNFYNIVNLVKPYCLSWRDFSKNYVIWDKVWTGNGYVDTIAGYKNLNGFLMKISPYFLRRTKTDVGMVIPKNIQTRQIDSHPVQEQLYKFVKNVTSEENDEEKIFAWLQILRLVDDDPHLLLTSESPKSQILLGHVKEMPTLFPKIKELCAVLEEDSGKVVVFTQFAKMAEIIRSHLVEEGKVATMITGATDDKEQSLNEFVQSPCQDAILVCTDTMSYGVNLDCADTLVNFDLPWNPAKMNQRIDRIHRINSTRPKTIINFVGSGIEKRVWEVVCEKKDLFEKVVEGKSIDDIDIRKQILQKFMGDNGG